MVAGTKMSAGKRLCKLFVHELREDLLELWLPEWHKKTWRERQVADIIKKKFCLIRLYAYCITPHSLFAIHYFTSNVKE